MGAARTAEPAFPAIRCFVSRKIEYKGIRKIISANLASIARPTGTRELTTGVAEAKSGREGQCSRLQVDRQSEGLAGASGGDSYRRWNFHDNDGSCSYLGI
jgi:hypothetical protein